MTITTEELAEHIATLKQFYDEWVEDGYFEAADSKHLLHAVGQALPALTERPALIAEVERLRGLLWYAWSEFNTIRARDGAPRASDPGDPMLVSEDWWSQMTDAFAEAIGKEAAQPWPSREAKAAISQPTQETTDAE